MAHHDGAGVGKTSAGVKAEHNFDRPLFRFPLRGQTGAGGFPPRRDTPRANQHRCHASCGGSPHKRAAAPLCIPRSATIIIALGVGHSRKNNSCRNTRTRVNNDLVLSAVRWPVFTRPSLAAFHLTAEVDLEDLLVGHKLMYTCRAGTNDQPGSRSGTFSARANLKLTDLFTKELSNLCVRLRHARSLVPKMEARRDHENLPGCLLHQPLD